MLGSLRKQEEAAKAERELKERKLEAARLRLEKALAGIESSKHLLLTLEERAAEIDRLQAEEQKRLASTAKEVAEMKEKLVKQQAQLLEQRTAERDTVAEISGAQSQNRSLAAKLEALDGRMQHQQEALYAIQFQEVVMRRKVARAQGVRSEDEKEALIARIQELTRTLEARSHCRRRSTTATAPQPGSAALRWRLVLLLVALACRCVLTWCGCCCLTGSHPNTGGCRVGPTRRRCWARRCGARRTTWRLRASGRRRSCARRAQ